MIWQLMKLDVSWRFVIRQTILFAAVAVLWHFFISKTDDADGPAVTLLLAVFAPLFSVGFTPLVQPLDARFQATIPVTVRDIFVVRITSTLALQWLPVLAGAVILTILGDHPASAMTMRMWWVFTCIVLNGQCAGILGLTMGRTLRLIALPLTVFSMNLAAFAWEWPLEYSTAWSLVHVCCWAVTAWVVVRTWRIVPKSFQLAPEEVSAGDAEAIPAGRTETRGLPWKAIVETTFPLWGFDYVVVFAAMCVVHSPVFLFFGVMTGWASIRSVIRWMSPLPVRPRVLLAVVVVPNLLSLIGGYLVGVHLQLFQSRLGDTGVHTQIVTLIIIAVWLMAANLCVLSGDSRWVRRVLPPLPWSTFFALALMLVALGIALGTMLITHLDPVQWLSSLLFAHLAGSIAAAILLLGALLWALDAVFKQLEFTDKPARGVA